MSISGATIAQEKSKVEILNADKLEFEQHPTRGKIKKLIGKVALKESDVILHADTALIFEDSSDFEAFGHVKIKKGDSLVITSEKLYFDNGLQLAKLSKNVVLDNKEINLQTKILNYYLEEKYGHFPTEGKLKHPDFNLTCDQGFYFEEANSTKFIGNVKLIGQDYKVIGDTLSYNYKNKKSTFFGPTSIQTDTSTAFCNYGYSNPKTNELYLEDHAWYHSKQNQVKGDSLWFNQKTQMGWAKKDVEWIDSSRTKILYGQHAKYNSKTQIATITRKAVFADIMNEDTVFLAADTISIFDTFLIYPDSIYSIDQIDTLYANTDSMRYDSVFFLKEVLQDTVETKAVKAHYDVKILQEQMSGIADSMIYFLADSTFKFYGNPVVWTDSSQITGDILHIALKNKVIDQLFMIGNTAMASIVFEPHFYNQIVGDKITGFFKNDTIEKMLVESNSESIYFIQDEENRFVGVNKGSSENILVRLENQAIKQVVLLKSAKAKFIPIKNVSPKQFNFPRFSWSTDFKPTDFNSLIIPGRFHHQKNQ